MATKHTLSILIPQYDEDFPVLKPLMDSLAIQQCVDFTCLDVIIVNDGSDVRLDKSDFEKYPFKVTYRICEHQGVSATRNKCLELSEAEYVMWCDADDMFYNNCGLWIVFNEMDVEGGFDGLISTFVEESRDDDQKPLFINHENDSTFVHGKIWRREYLIQNNLKFNPKLTIHEDSYFNILARNFSENIKYCPTPFYLWKWRDNSVCRHDPKYILKTFNNMIDSNTELVKDFKSRGKEKDALSFICSLVFDAYYTMCKPEWKNQENQQYRRNTELRFKQYYIEFKKEWDSIPDQDKMFASTQIRNRQVFEGMEMEDVTMKSWLEYVMNLT